MDLLEQHGEKFTDDFQKNKQVTHQIIGTPSKKLRNVIAGYATRLKRRGSDL